MPIQRAHTDRAPAISTTGLGHVPEICAGTNTSETGAAGLTPGVTALIFPNLERATGTETKTTGTLSPVPSVNTSKEQMAPLPTPINVKELDKELREHPDRIFVTKLCSYLKTGADICYTGSRTARFSKNLPTALAQPEIVSDNLAKEVALGRLAGPFSALPFPNLQVSPIGLVPKKHSNKVRTIFHLFFPKSGVTSINYSISKDHSLQYITDNAMQYIIDNAIQGILRHGRGCFLAKTDIESAFRLIPLKPSDYELFGMFWDGNYNYDKVLPFGLRSAPFLFNMLSDAVEWILLNKCYISFVCHILDDFLIIEPTSPSPPPPPHIARQVRLACLACSSHSEILVSLWQLTKPKAQTMP